MNKVLKALAVLVFAGSVITCCVADDDCGCKTTEEKDKQEQTERVPEAPEVLVEEECAE